MHIETIILQNIIINEKFQRLIIPHLTAKFFQENNGLNLILFKEIVNYFVKYDKAPTQDELIVEISQSTSIKDDDKRSDALDIVEMLYEKIEVSDKWLYDTSLKWVKDRAIVMGLIECTNILEGKVKKKTKDSIPDILAKALAIEFDSSVGHDYYKDIEERHDFYNRDEEKIPFDLAKLNQITDGGLKKKSIMVIVAPTAVGKSLFMCHLASSYLVQGKNVLYITMEMSEYETAKRIDANLLDIRINEVKHTSKSKFTDNIKNLKTKTNGQMIIKEYPTRQAHAGHFRALLSDLKTKKKFKPDAIFIDYLNICKSFAIPEGAGMYNVVKGIAEELRALAVFYDIPLVTATQVNRSGMKNKSFELDDISESIGVSHIADLVIGLLPVSKEVGDNLIEVKQLKNRYNSVDENYKFLIGMDKSRMKLKDHNLSEPPPYNPKNSKNMNSSDDVIDVKDKFATF